MNLAATMSLYFGGEGSGCNPEMAEAHGTTCGPKIQKKSWGESAKEKYAKYQQGLTSEKKLFGVWNYNSGTAKLIKTLLSGEWHSVESLKSQITDLKNVEARIAKVGLGGKKLDLWKLEYKDGKTSVRLVMKDFGNAAKGQVDISDKQQHAALAAVSKLMSNTGLDPSFSSKVMDEFMKDAGLTSLSKVKGAVGAWVGWPTSEGGTWLRKIASDYYGRPWNSEYSGKDSGASSIAGKAVDPQLHEQVLAVKALSTAYAQADGTQYVYRGTGVSKDTLNLIIEAKAKGSEFCYIPVNSLASYSTKLGKAESFSHGEVVMRREVAPEDVWFAHKAMSHMLGGNEAEYIMGTKETSVKIKTSDVWIKDTESKPPWQHGELEKSVYESKIPKPLVAIDPKSGVNYLETKMSGQKGSNEGGTYKGSDGVERYVKFYKNPSQGQGEALANTIYKDLGIGAPDAKIISAGPHKEAYASTIIPGGKTLSETGVASDDAKSVLKGFAADVLTANWDAVGTGYDNILSKGGEHYRIDNGGSFLFRAQGSYKPVEALNKIGEWDTFFTKNKYYSDLAKKAGVTKAEQIPDLDKQIKSIVKLRDAHSGWDNYIEKKAPYVRDKDQIVAMLEARTKLLKEKVMNIQSSVELHAGGPGSGRKPSYAKGLNKWKSPEKERKLAFKDPKQMKLPLKAGGPGSGRRPWKVMQPEFVSVFKKHGMSHMLASPKEKEFYHQGGTAAATGRLKGHIQVHSDGSWTHYPSDKAWSGRHGTLPKEGAHGSGANELDNHLSKVIKAGEVTVESERGPISRKLGKTITKQGTQFCVSTDNDSLGCYPDKKAAIRVARGGSFIDFDVDAGGPGSGKKKDALKEYDRIYKLAKQANYPEELAHKVATEEYLKTLSTLKADSMGEPSAGAYQHAHIEPRQWFSPPSLKDRGLQTKVPVDDPGNKDNKFLDVTKRNSKDTQEQRMKILKRKAPGGLPPLVPVHTTAVPHHTAVGVPGMFASRRKRLNGGSFRAFNAARI